MKFNYCAKKLDSNSGYLIIWQQKMMFNECLYCLCKRVHMKWNCREMSRVQLLGADFSPSTVVETELKIAGLRGKPLYLVSHVTDLFT